MLTIPSTLPRQVLIVAANRTDILNGRICIIGGNRILFGTYATGSADVASDDFNDKEETKPTLQWEDSPGTDGQAFDLVFYSKDFDGGNGYVVYIEE